MASTTRRMSATTLPTIDDLGPTMPFTTSPLPLARPRLASAPSAGPAPAPGAAYLLSPPRAPAPPPHTVQTRVVGRNASASWADVACSPPAPAAARTRRPSSGANSTPLRERVRSNSSIGALGAAAPFTPSWPHHGLAPEPFERPAYLDHSVLRDLLLTEKPAQPSAPSFGLQDAATDGAAKSGNGAMVGSMPVFRLPTRWSEQDRHQYLSVSPDGRDLIYTGNQSPDPVLARANHAVPPACGIYYYEVDVLSKNSKAQISIGFTTAANKHTKLPGWEKDSWGYHGDDGFSYAAEKSGTPYGPTFGAGDTVGAGIDFSTARAFFTKNGVLIGPVFDLSPTLNAAAPGAPILFPSIGLRHAQEAVRANFGGPFRFDVDEHAAGARDAVWAQIRRTELTPDWLAGAGAGPGAAPMDTDVIAEEDEHEAGAGAQAEDRQAAETRTALGGLVLEYLVHHGFAGAARALRAQLAREPGVPDVGGPETPRAPAAAGDEAAEGEGEEEEEEVARRLAVLRAVQRGDVDAALAQAEAHFPAALEARGARVRLALRCRKFVELVNGAAAHKRAAEARAPAGDADGMDVDADGDAAGEAEAALRAAIAYGQGLRAEYRGDARPEVQAALEQAFGVVAYRFPTEARGAVGRWAGQAGRDALAEEVNAAILESLGCPRQPALERAFRQALATTTQLGLLGCGAAVFADVRAELLDG